MSAGYLLAQLQDRNQPVRYWNAVGFVAFTWRGVNGKSYGGYEQNTRQGCKVIVYRTADANWSPA